MESHFGFLFSGGSSNSMKKQLLLGVSLAALAAIGPTQAAPLPTPVFNWTGWYVGGNAGYSWGNADSTYTDPGFGVCCAFGLPTTFSGTERLNGFIGGGQVGYNWQPNSLWVFGFETDFQGSGEKGSRSYSNGYSYDCEGTCSAGINQTQSAKIEWFGTVRGRIGSLLTPTLLAYATGGLAYGKISSSGTVNDTFPGCPASICSWSYSNSATNVGWTVGSGIEGLIPGYSSWTWKLEYLYIDFGTVSGSGIDPDFTSPGIYTWSTKVTDNIFRFGINYKVP